MTEFMFWLLLYAVPMDDEERIDLEVDYAYSQATFERDEDALDWGKQEDWRL